MVVFWYLYTVREIHTMKFAIASLYPLYIHTISILYIYSYFIVRKLQLVWKLDFRTISIERILKKISNDNMY
jgi:hypothetical protein